jgi:hypothetical protein
MAILSGLGIVLALLMARHKQHRPGAIDLAAAAAATSHTIPTRPVTVHGAGPDGLHEPSGAAALSAPSDPG